MRDAPFITVVSIPEEKVAPGEDSRGIRALISEALLAIATLTAWPILGERRQGSAEQRARAMLWIPLPALALGVALALVDHALESVAPPLWRSLAIVALSQLACGAIYPVGLAHASGELRAGRRPSWTGLTEVGPLGVLAGLATVALEVYLLASIAHPPSRERAIVLATMLARWAIVPVAYGLKPLGRDGLGVAFEGGIKFREFAGASVIALAVAMGLYEVVAIALIAVLAMAILLLRLLYSRRLGGVDGHALAAAAALFELVAFALLAAIRF